MRGLLKKDWYVIKNLKKILIILVLMIVFLMIGQQGNIEESVSFIMGYATIFSTIMVINVMEIDEKQKSNAFLFTLPVSRKEYVLEKYLFGILMGLAAWLISALSVTAIICIRRADVQWIELLVQGAAMLALLFLMLGFEIPVQLKFGGEKGRIIVIATVMVLCLGVVSIAKMLEKRGIDWMGKLEWFVVQSWSWIAMAAAVAAFFALSVLYSIHLIGKKEY